MPPGGRPLARSSRCDLRVQARHVRGLGELREQQRVEAHRDHGGEVGRVLRRPGRVDAHDALAAAEVDAAEGRHHPLAGLGLLGRRDGVLQIEDDAVHRHRRRLGDALRPGAGHEEEAAPEPGHARPRRCDSTSKPAVRRASTMGRVSHG